MNIKNIHHATALTSATVPIADPIDGLIKTADLNTPIPVLVAVWEGSEPGYQCQLVLNDILTGEVRTLTDADQVGDMLPFELNEALLNKDDSFSLGYRVYSPDTEVANFSPTIPLRVDRTPPGASLLASMIFPNASFGDYLVGLVPGYAGMEPGDVIQTLCNGSQGPVHTVQADELTLRPIEISFDRALFQSLAADTVLIEYVVTDRAGNQSVTSLPVLMTVKL